MDVPSANSELFGRLAPRTNALIRPRSVVKSTIRLSYSPIGMADRTIPFTVTVSICFPFYKLTSRPRDIQNSSCKVAVAPVLTHFDKQLN